MNMKTVNLKISVNLIKILFIAYLSVISLNGKIFASTGDTTWVTTFNQNFQNWADVHYGNFNLPDTNTHFKQILMYYTIGCPSSGCDPWDRLGWIKLYTDSTYGYEIARIITPYNIVGGGYPGQCVFVLDVTDFMPLLHDQVRLGSYIESWIGGTRGWLVTVKFAFIEGEMPYKPFKVINLWQDNHVLYGDPSNPPESHLPARDIQIDPLTAKAKVKVTTTGHGQGNTDNAAEFSFKIHTLLVGSSSYSHNLWRGDCSSNPCSPQGGTWQFARAGWCPGASVIPWENDVSDVVIPGQNINIDYNLQEFENFCRPTNPSCVNGVTCSDCNFNNNGHTEPHYTIQSQLILYKANPFINIENTGSEVPDTYSLEQNYPNPFNPVTSIKFSVKETSSVKLNIYDVQGRLIEKLFAGNLNPGEFRAIWNGSGFASGIYIYKLEVSNGKEPDFVSSKKMMLVK